MAGAAEGSDDTLHKFDERWRALNDLERTSDQPVEHIRVSRNKLNKQFGDVQRPNSPQEAAEDFDEVLTGISHRLDYGTSERKAIYDRLLAIEHQTKKRGSRGFTRYLLAICIGVTATLAWQSYGEAAKQIFATKVPELGWSPESKQMIANWVQQFGWTKPGAGPQRTAVQPSVPETQVATVAQTVPAAVTPQAPATPPIDPEQVHQIAVDLAALGQTVDQLAASQDQIGHNIDRLQGAVAEILVKMPEPPPLPPSVAAAPAHKPKPPVTPPSSRAATPLYAPPHP
jgi:hypothetical protein